MPANLTPDYHKAEQWFKSASTNEEKILAMEEMLRVIPNHKGTDHMRAELRRKLSYLKEAGEKKAGAKHVDIFHVPRGGAGQIVLLGTPNCGKSSIVAAMTRAKVVVADFPFATAVPVPGMIKFEDIQIELVDMPPITADYSAPGQVGTYRNCDIIGIVIDLSGDVEEQMLICLDFLESKKLLLNGQTAAIDEHGRTMGRKAVCICTKTDIAKPGAMEILKQSCGHPFEFLAISTQTGEGLEKLAPTFFKLLNVIRVYAKPPGKEPDMKEPFVVPAGSTVMDLAVVIHRQLAEKLKSARIWGSDVYKGQHVQKNHILCDKDIVELHFQ